MYTTYVLSEHQGRKTTVWDPLELEEWTVVTSMWCWKPQSSAKETSTFNCLAISTSGSHLCVGVGVHVHMCACVPRLKVRLEYQSSGAVHLAFQTRSLPALANCAG